MFNIRNVRAINNKQLEPSDHAYFLTNSNRFGFRTFGFRI